MVMHQHRSAKPAVKERRGRRDSGENCPTRLGPRIGVRSRLAPYPVLQARRLLRRGGVGALQVPGQLVPLPESLKELPARLPVGLATETEATGGAVLLPGFE